MSEQITITEALAELKTISKRLASKRQFIVQNSVRHGVLRDPFEKGGSTQAEQIGRERQAHNDLMARWVSIRDGIAKANAETRLVVEGVNRTVAEWLIWRREFADDEHRLLAQMQGAAQQIRKEIADKFGAAEGQSDERMQAVVNFDEAAVSEEAERIESILGRLDGALSLHNARTSIEV